MYLQTAPTLRSEPRPPRGVGAGTRKSLMTMPPAEDRYFGF